MNTILLRTAALAILTNTLLVGAPAEPAKPEPVRLKRSQSFLGIHFDFHATADCKDVGLNTTPEMVASILDQVRPDYIQVDCKGHPGYSSYPTKVGNPVPGIVGDPLRVWREVTASRGVALYLHYSGVWDSRAIEKHPEWAAVNADGKPNSNATSVFGPYVDQLLIPQLRELAGNYGIDGIWVDGECWATVPDYGPAAVAAYRRDTGAVEVPKKPGDPDWFGWMQFHREAFRKYLRHYLAEVNGSHPNFEIASNWAFSDHMPEPVSAPVAFLSGDFSPQNSVNSARFSARCLANQGLAWDLMSWSFADGRDGKRHQKSAIQLQREAALVLAQGGGYQAYFTQRRDGSVDVSQMGTMAEVARFCRARQAVSHRTRIVPQIALLYSQASHYRQSPRLFAPDSPTVRSLRGTLETLVQSQHGVQIVSEHHLRGHLADWPLIVLPECAHLDADFRKELIEYVRGGGTLLAIGPQCASHFAQETGVKQVPPTRRSRLLLERGGDSAVFEANWATVAVAPGASRLGSIRPHDAAANAPAAPAATVSPFGKGTIAATWVDLAGPGADPKSPGAARFLDALVRDVFPKPRLEVTGSRDVDVSLAEIGGRTVIHLVNASGPHVAEGIIDSINAIGPVTVSLRTQRAPRTVTLEPGGKAVDVQYTGGIARFTVPSVPVHVAAVVD